MRLLHSAVARERGGDTHSTMRSSPPPPHPNLATRTQHSVRPTPIWIHNTHRNTPVTAKTSSHTSPIHTLRPSPSKHHSNKNAIEMWPITCYQDAIYTAILQVIIILIYWAYHLIASALSFATLFLLFCYHHDYVQSLGKISAIKHIWTSVQHLGYDLAKHGLIT